MQHPLLPQPPGRHESGAPSVFKPRARRCAPSARMAPMAPTTDQVRESVRSVIDPELRRDIVELEMVRSIEVHPNGVVDVIVSLTTAGCPIRSHFQTGVAQAVR